MTRTVQAALASLLLLLAACAPSNSVRSSPTGGRSDLLTEEQLRDQSYNTAYEAVLSLRPNWLRTRGTDSFRSPGQVQVYVDNMRMGGVGNLQQIPAIAVYWIRWYDGLDAAARWGLDHGNGVIYVSTSRDFREN